MTADIEEKVVDAYRTGKYTQKKCMFCTEDSTRSDRRESLIYFCDRCEDKVVSRGFNRL